MKNKKLLSLLCLVTLVGCGTKTSTSSTNNQPSSPASSSTVAPSSPVSSSTEESSSTAPSSSTVVDSSSTTVDSSSTVVDSSSNNSSENSTPVVTPDTPTVRLANFQEHVLSTIGEELVSYTLAKSNTSSTNKTLTSTVYNTNCVEIDTTNVRGYEEVVTSKYYTTANNRFYEIDADVEVNMNWSTMVESRDYTATSVKGYEIVEEAESSAQVTQADIDAKYSFSSAMVDGFGMGKSIEGLINAAFETYDEDNSYNITFGTTYVDSKDVEGSVTTVSYYTEKITPHSASVYHYSYEFGYDANGKLSYANFVQDSFDSEAYNFDTHSLNYGYTASNKYFYTYSFNFGTRTEAEIKYDIESLTFEDYEVKFYSDEECTVESTTFENGNRAYVKVTGVPEDVTTDTVMVYSVSNSDVTSVSAGQFVDSIYFNVSGEATFTFASANGIKKSVTVTVTAPAPKGISCYAEFPEVLSVGETIELPWVSVSPYTASQEYKWVIASGTECAETYYDEEADLHYIKALATGTFTFYACPLADESIRTETYEIEVIEPKSEEEIKSILTSNTWAVNDGVIYSMTLSEDGKGLINFGRETTYAPGTGSVEADVDTTYSFDYELDYANAAINVSNGTWANRSETGTFASFTDPVITPSLLGDKVNVSFGGYYSFDFIPALTETEVKEAYQSSFSGCFFQYEYLELAVDFTATHATFYAIAYIRGEEYRKCEVTVEYTWNADGNIELVGGDLEYAAFMHYDYETNSDVTTNIVINSVLKADKYLASYLNVTITANGTSYTTRFSEMN